MHLAIEELKASYVFQELTVGDEDVQLAHVRPHIYKHLAPSGGVKVQVCDANGQLIAESNTVTITDISDANYFHGYVRFDIDVALKANTTYRIGLKTTSPYAFAEAAWVGWCLDFDLRKYQVDYSPNEGLKAPFDVEIYVKKKLRRS